MVELRAALIQGRVYNDESHAQGMALVTEGYEPLTLDVA